MLGNETKVTEFILLGFGEFHDFQIPLFLTVLVVYMVTITGNMLIFSLVVSDKHLHTPMYFFLANLSILEASSSSTILPRLLSAVWMGEKRISFRNCFTQWYLCGSFLVTECCLLCAMCYDRYLAICKPLHYTTRMNTLTCIQLAAASWINGFTVLLTLLILTLKLNFCGPNVIEHYYCDFVPLLKLSCSDTNFVKKINFILVCIYVELPFLLTLTSYVYIIVAIMRIPSANGRKKAFSTCSSHLVVVSLFYGSLMIVYMLPKTEEEKSTEKFSSLLYTVLPPLANPFIYSLRNKDVKNALKLILSGLYHKKQVS